MSATAATAAARRRLLLLLLPRRTYATVRQDLQNLYHLPKPASAIRPRPPPKHLKPSPAASEDLTAVQRRRWMVAAGAAGVGTLVYLLASSPPLKAEGTPSPSLPPLSLVPRPGLVDSGTTSVPPFPLVVQMGEAGDYVLVGHGVRTVSFLGIQVYVVGFYVHRDDVAVLRKALEKEGRGRLLDAAGSEEVWERILGDGEVKFRSLFRIVPTRNTDFQHLRDGWVRSIQARSGKQEAYDDEKFVEAMVEFKSMFGKKTVPKQKTLVLVRDADGVFSALFDVTGRNDGTLGSKMKKVQRLGEVRDARVAKALWLCYLAGANPASPPARENIVDGLLGKA